MPNPILLRKLGNAIQDAVYAESLRAGTRSLPSFTVLNGAQMAEVGMTGSFDIDLPDGGQFRVDVRERP